MSLRLIEDILRSHVQREYKPGHWIPARPLPGPMIWRLRDAWSVLVGYAEAVYWPDDQPAGRSPLDREEPDGD